MSFKCERSIVVYTDSCTRNSRAVFAVRTATAPVPLVTIRVIFFTNDQFLRFAEDQAIRRRTLKPEEDFYKFHNHYWRRHLRIKNWASKDDGPSKYLPAGANPARLPLFTQLNARDPLLESTAPDFAFRIPEYPQPSTGPQRFMGKILRSPIHPTANFQAGYSIDDVVRDNTSDQAMADSILVALAEGIVPPAHISNVYVKLVKSTTKRSDSLIVLCLQEVHRYCQHRIRLVRSSARQGRDRVHDQRRLQILHGFPRRSARYQQAVAPAVCFLAQQLHAQAS